MASEAEHQQSVAESDAIGAMPKRANFTEAQAPASGWEVRRLRSKVISWIEASFTPEKDEECRRKGALTTDMIIYSTPEAMREFLLYMRASLELSDICLRCDQYPRGEDDLVDPFRIHMELTAEKRAEYGASHPECLLRQGMLTSCPFFMSPVRKPAARRRRRSSQVAPMEASPSMAELLDRINRQAVGAPLVAHRPDHTTPQKRKKRASSASQTMTPVLDQPRAGSTSKKATEPIADDRKASRIEAHDNGGGASKKAKQQSTDEQVTPAAMPVEGAPLLAAAPIVETVTMPAQYITAAPVADRTLELAATPVETPSTGSIGPMLSAAQMQSLLQKFIDDRRATGGPFNNSTSASGSISISTEETRRVMKAYMNSDAELAEELARLHMVVLSSGAELNAEWKQRCVRAFKGLVTYHRGQGSYVLGRAGAARSPPA